MHRFTNTIKLKSMDFYNLNPKVLSGIPLSAAIQSILKEKIGKIQANKSIDKLYPPKLKVILIGSRKDSRLYVDNKLKLCDQIGVVSELSSYPDDTLVEDVLYDIDKANNDPSVHGILIQLPLPSHLPVTQILNSVKVEKDVDGLHPLSQGKMLQMSLNQCLIPPTAMGVLELLRLAVDYDNNLTEYIDRYLVKHFFSDMQVDLSGKDVCILGRGLTAGLPLSILMQKCNATITLCHSKTKNIEDKMKNADILISAVGKKNLVGVDNIKEESILIDVGINVTVDSEGKKKISGDMDFESMLDKTKYMTPVPGGVGKMTVVMLLKNVLKAWGTINNIDLNKM